MTLTTFVRFLKIVYSALAPQMFYFIGFFCLWLLSFEALVFYRHITMFFYHAQTAFPDDFSYIGMDSDVLLLAGHYQDSILDPSFFFYTTHQPQLRFYFWSFSYNPQQRSYGTEYQTSIYEHIMAEKNRQINLKNNSQKIDHGYFFLSTELFGRVKLSSDHKWAYYGAGGSQYSYHDYYEDMIVDPTLNNAPSRYTVEYMRYNLAFFFSDPFLMRSAHLPQNEVHDDNFVADTLSYSLVGFFFMNSMRNDFWITSADYFLFRHHDDTLTQQDEEDINTAYHVFMNVPRCLDFAKNEGIIYNLFEKFNDEFTKSASEEEIFFLMEHFGESDFVYDDVYIDSIEDDELGGPWDFVGELDFDVITGEDYDDTIWELRWDPAIDYALSNIIKGSDLYRYTKFVHIDHMKNYPWWYGLTTKQTSKRYYDFRIGCDFFLKKKIVERDKKIRAEVIKLDSFVKAFDDVFHEISQFEIQQSKIIQEMAIDLGFERNQIVSIMEEGPNLDYKTRFEEQKKKKTPEELIKIDALEQILDKIKYEEIPKLMEKAHKIKDEETAYKMELDYIHFQRERGLDENAEINLEEADEYTILKYKQKKQKIRDEKIKKIEEENKKFKDLIKYEDDYLLETDEDNYYDAYEENDYEEEENFYENDEEYEKQNNEDFIIEEEEEVLLDINKIHYYDENEEINLELELEKFKIEKTDFLNMNDVVNSLVDELYNLEKQKDLKNVKKEEILTINDEENDVYFSEYGSKYKKLLTINDYTDNIIINDKELYDFFSICINKEQIIEIFEWDFIIDVALDYKYFCLIENGYFTYLYPSLNLFDHLIFFDKFNLNFNEELLIIGEESKKFFFYTHWYTKACGFNILKDFYYFNHDVDTFILLYPLYSSEFNPLFLDSESIFYNSFKVELSYSDITTCISEEQSNTLEEINTVDESDNNIIQTNELSLVELNFILKKKYKNIFFFFDKDIFDINYNNIIETIFNYNKETTIVDNNNLEKTRENIIETDKKAFFKTFGKNITNEELNFIVKQQQQDILNNEQFNIETTLNSKIINDYHLNMDLSRTYYPPTVRDHEREEYFLDRYLYRFIGGTFATRTFYVRKYKLPDEVYYLDREDRAFDYTDLNQRLQCREVFLEYRKHKRFLRRKRRVLRFANKQMKFFKKKIFKFFFCLKLLTPIIKSFLTDPTNRFVVQRDADPLSARIGYDIGKAASYEPYTENIYDFKLENAVKASFNGLFSTYDMLTFDYDWEIRHDILWDENDFHLQTEIVDADLYEYEPATPLGVTKNEKYYNLVFDSFAHEYDIYAPTILMKKGLRNGYGMLRMGKLLRDLDSKFSTIIIKILTNIISFCEGNGGTQSLYFWKFFEDLTLTSRKFNGRADHWWKGKRARLFSYRGGVVIHNLLKYRNNRIFSKTYDYPCFYNDEYKLKSSKSDLLDEKETIWDGEFFFDYDDYVLYSRDDDFRHRKKYFNYLVPFSRTVQDLDLYNIEEEFALNFENLDDDEIYYYLLDKEINNFIEDFLDDDDIHNIEILTPIYDIGMNLTLLSAKKFYKGFIVPTVLKKAVPKRLLKQTYFTMEIIRDRVFHKIKYKRNYLLSAFEPDIFTLYFAVFTIINFTRSYILQESLRYGHFNFKNIPYVMKSIREKQHLGRNKSIYIFNEEHLLGHKFGVLWYNFQVESRMKMTLAEFPVNIKPAYFENLFRLEKELMRVKIFRVFLKYSLYKPLYYLKKFFNFREKLEIFLNRLKTRESSDKEEFKDIPQYYKTLSWNGHSVPHMFPFFGNFAYGDMGLLALGLGHTNMVTDFFYPEHDHYEHFEWFYYIASANEEAGHRGNFPEGDWNFFMNHEDYFGMARSDLDYGEWTQYGYSQVSRPQRFLYEHHWEAYVSRIPRTFRTIGSSTDVGEDNFEEIGDDVDDYY